MSQIQGYLDITPKWFGVTQLNSVVQRQPVAMVQRLLLVTITRQEILWDKNLIKIKAQ